MPRVRGRQRPTMMPQPLVKLRDCLDALLPGQAWWWGRVDPETARQSFAFHLDHLFGNAARERAEVDHTANPSTR